MDQKQLKIAKGIAQLRATGTAGAATEEIAKAAEEAMEKMIAFEQRGDMRLQAKTAAELERRKKLEDARQVEEERRQLRTNTRTNETVSRIEKYRTRQSERDQTTEERIVRKRAAELERRKRDVEVLVEREEAVADERVRSARDRELERRAKSSAKQEQDHAHEQSKELSRRQHEVWRREAERHVREQRDPQLVRSKQVQDLSRPYALRSQVAPYAIQAQPMRNVLSRWTHPD